MFLDNKFMFKYNWYYYYILLKRLYSLNLYITLKNNNNKTFFFTMHAFLLCFQTVLLKAHIFDVGLIWPIDFKSWSLH